VVVVAIFALEQQLLLLLQEFLSLLLYRDDGDGGELALG
jgi:hypothetical protein